MNTIKRKNTLNFTVPHRVPIKLCIYILQELNICACTNAPEDWPTLNYCNVLGSCRDIDRDSFENNDAYRYSTSVGI